MQKMSGVHNGRIGIYILLHMNQYAKNTKIHPKMGKSLYSDQRMQQRLYTDVILHKLGNRYLQP